MCGRRSMYGISFVLVLWIFLPPVITQMCDKTE